MVDEFVDASNTIDYPRVVFVHGGTTAEGEEFFSKRAPGSAAIADPDALLYRSFAVGRGGMREMFGLRSWLAGIRTFLAGHRIGRKVGDPWTLPVVIGVADSGVIWEHRGEHAGDNPDPQEVPAEMRAVAT